MYITSSILYKHGISNETIAFFKSFKCPWMYLSTFIGKMHGSFRSPIQLYQNFKLTGLCYSFYNKRVHTENRFYNGDIVWSNIYDTSHIPRKNFIVKHYKPKEVIKC